MKCRWVIHKRVATVIFLLIIPVQGIGRCITKVFSQASIPFSALISADDQQSLTNGYPYILTICSGATKLRMLSLLVVSILVQNFAGTFSISITGAISTTPMQGD